MAKKSSKNQAKQQQLNPSVIAIVVVAVLFAIGGVVLVLSDNDEDSSNAANSGNMVPILNSELANETSDATVRTRLSPDAYMTDFAEDAPHVLLDVREDWEFADGHIDGASNISVSALASNVDRIPQDVPIIVYCRSGNRSAEAAQILAANGFTQVYDLGGVLGWQAAGLDLVR
jgi:phage shock protein E